MKKYIYKPVLAALVLGALASCQKEEDRVFNETVSERIDQREIELSNSLLSSEYGWKLVYFTDSKRLGGFTYMIKFEGGRHVRMISDFTKEGLTEETGEYQIKMRGTTSLIFSTRNKIHELSDPINSPVEGGKGYLGEYQFGYYGQNEDGSEMYFRTPKQGQNVVFIKATKEDWDNMPFQFDMVSNMNLVDQPMFRVIEVNVGGEKTTYDADYGIKTRYLTIDKGSDLNAQSGMAIAYTKEGVKVTPGIKVGNDVATDFVFDATKKEFIYENNGNSAKIQYSLSPSSWSESYKYIAFDRAEVVTFSAPQYAIFEGPNATDAYYDAVFDSEGKSLLSQLAMFHQNGKLRIQYNLAAGGSAVFSCTLKDSDGKGQLVMENGSWQGNPSAVVKTIHEKLFSSPMYIKEQTYKFGGGNTVVTYYFPGTSVVFDTWISS